MINSFASYDDRSTNEVAKSLRILANAACEEYIGTVCAEVNGGDAEPGALFILRKAGIITGVKKFIPFTSRDFYLDTDFTIVDCA